jgi:uncharacterized membrane protein required for colicin V production
MVSQIVSVGSLLVCWLVASRFAFLFAPSIPAEAPWNKIGAMVVLFAVTMLAIWFLHGRLEQKIKDWKLAKVNRFLGGLLGFIKGFVLCMILTFFCVTLSEATRTMVFQSKSGKYLTASIAKVGTFAPKDSCELLQTQLDLFNSKMNGETGNTVSGSLNPEEDSLQKMLSDGKLSIADGQQGFGSVLTQSNKLLQQAKQLQDDWQEQEKKAVSLFDAVGKFFWGSKNTPSAEEIIPSEQAVGPEKDNKTPAVLFAAKEQDTGRQEIAPVNNGTNDNKPMPLITKPAPAYQEDAFFSRPAEPVKPQTEDNDVPPTLDKLSALLPLSSLPQFEETGITEQVMLPQSAAAFRLSGGSAERPLNQLFSSSRSADTPPATVFVPKR